MDNERGIITVEASVICAVTIGVMIFIFLMACYFSDMHRLQAEAMSVARLGLACQEGCADMDSGRIDWDAWQDKNILDSITADFSSDEEKLADEFEDRITGALWFGNTADVAFSVSSGKIIVTYSGSWQTPLGNKWFVGALPFSGNITVSQTDVKSMMRLIDGVIRGFGG